ncbi:hypothetical protein MVEN_00692600 [Mycena venus]|uniref:Uncharacterized protein n=1 Tax=Mycena venus TaxID=2733690 RepID=A0A8H7D538_9AGAR|nr:hypothetical protein MVEN_00692600 [Mycena venus]
MYAFKKQVVISLSTAIIFCLSFALWCVVPSGPPVTLEPATSGCITYFPHSREIGAWEAMLAGDILLLALTLHRGYTHSRDFHSGSLWRVLIRDGEYIVIVTAISTS